MALHGDVSVNGRRLLAWQAQRRKRYVKADQAATYDCQVTDSLGFTEVFVVSHRWADGAAVLAREVLDAYHRRAGACVPRPTLHTLDASQEQDMAPRSDEQGSSGTTTHLG